MMEEQVGPEEIKHYQSLLSEPFNGQCPLVDTISTVQPCLLWGDFVPLQKQAISSIWFTLFVGTSRNTHPDGAIHFRTGSLSPITYSHLDYHIANARAYGVYIYGHSKEELPADMLIPRGKQTCQPAECLHSKMLISCMTLPPFAPHLRR